MRIFEEQKSRLQVGQEAEDFPINDNLSLADLEGQTILLVFWKAL